MLPPLVLLHRRTKLVMVEGRREEKADSTDSRTRKKEEEKERSTPRASSRVATKDVVGSNFRREHSIK